MSIRLILIIKNFIIINFNWYKYKKYIIFINLLKVKFFIFSNSELIFLLIRATSSSKRQPDKVDQDSGIYPGIKSLIKSTINGFSITSKGIPAIIHAFNNEWSIRLFTWKGSGLFELKYYIIFFCNNCVDAFCKFQI